MIKFVAISLLVFSAFSYSSGYDVTLSAQESYEASDYVAVIEVLSGTADGGKISITAKPIVLLKGDLGNINFSFYEFMHMRSEDPKMLGAMYLVFLKKDKHGKLKPIESAIFSFDVARTVHKQLPYLDFKPNHIEDKSENLWFSGACVNNKVACNKYQPYLEKAFDMLNH